MGHAEHFLRRLDRVADPHVELSLTLYRDEDLLREVLARADAPTQGSRVAISLDDDVEGPFLIVTREGRFVTCLGRGMRIGPELALLTRPRLDAAIAKVERMRERVAALHTAEARESGGETARLLSATVKHGLGFAREDAAKLVEVWPLIAPVATPYIIEFAKRVDVDLPQIAGLRADKLRPVERDFVDAWWRMVTAASTLLVISECEGAEAAEARYRPLPDGHDPRLTVAWILCSMPSVANYMRALWFVGRRPKRALAYLRSVNAVGQSSDRVLRELGLAMIASRSSKLRTEVEKLSRRAPKIQNDALREVHHQLASAIGAWAKKFREEPDLLTESENEMMRAIGKLYTGRDDFPLELTGTLFACEPNGVMSQPDFIYSILHRLPWLAQAEVTDFFLPRALGAAHRTMSARFIVKTTARAFRLPVRVPAKAQPQPGRNEACPCGSGAKFKRCCARPAPATSDVAPRTDALAELELEKVANPRR